MAIEDAFYYHLTTDAGNVADIISTRLYPHKLPQKPTYEAMTYNLIADALPIAHDGPGDLVSSRYQFDCFAETHSEVITLAREVRNALNGFKGAMGQTGSQIDVHGIFFENMISVFEDEPSVWRAIVDFLINYRI